jgi:uncharacterized Zn ribbon protein
MQDNYIIKDITACMVHICTHQARRHSEHEVVTMANQLQVATSSLLDIGDNIIIRTDY